MGKNHEDDCKGGDDCRKDEHLCRIEKRGDKELVRKITRNPIFSCLKCGRSAHEAKNLCRPSI